MAPSAMRSGEQQTSEASASASASAPASGSASASASGPRPAAAAPPDGLAGEASQMSLSAESSGSSPAASSEGTPNFSSSSASRSSPIPSLTLPPAAELQRPRQIAVSSARAPSTPGGAATASSSLSARVNGSPVRPPRPTPKLMRTKSIDVTSPQASAESATTSTAVRRVDETAQKLVAIPVSPSPLGAPFTAPPAPCALLQPSRSFSSVRAVQFSDPGTDSITTGTAGPSFSTDGVLRSPIGASQPNLPSLPNLNPAASSPAPAQRSAASFSGGSPVATVPNRRATVGKTESTLESDNEPPETPEGAGADPPLAQPSTPACTPGPSSPSRQQTEAPSDRPMPSLWEYLKSESCPGPTVAVADPVWGATERDVMYNSLIYVPYQLERIMWFGLMVCMDPFMAMFTTVPLRAAKGLLDLLWGLLGRLRKSSSRGPWPSALLRGDQLYDILYLLLFAVASCVVSSINAGVIYFWMKDMSQEFIKLSVIFTAMEICDKIMTSFGVSALHSLSCSCTQYYTTPSFSALQVASDWVVATLITTTHAVTLMSEAIAFSVAMNSRRTTLLALVINFNFVEVKGTVFKKMDPYKLTNVVYQDVVERFHMGMLMLFVIIEDMDTSDSWGSLNWHLITQVGVILASELVADITKHAVVGKFNVIRPGVYREYMRDLCAAASKQQTSTLFKVVEMEPVATAAIFYRMMVSFLSFYFDQRGDSLLALIASWALLLIFYALACIFRLAWGFMVRWIAAAYLQYYDDNHGNKRSTSQTHKPSAAKKDL